MSKTFTRELYEAEGDYYYAGGLDDDGPVHVEVRGEVEEIPAEVQRLAVDHGYELVETHGYDREEDATLWEFRPVETDGGDDRDLPREYGYAGQSAGTVEDALDDLRAGDRVLWGDREVPCVVARVVEPEDEIGQSLTASVISSRVRDVQANDPARSDDPEEWFLQPGDVFLDPDTWGTLRGKRFAVIQGPRGGFYAVAEPEANRNYPALFRAVRTYHSTKMGQPGKGAWNYEEDLKDALTIVEAGDEPDDLDPGGDLPTYDEIRENRVVAFDRDEGEHYVVSETVEDMFEEGLFSAHRRAETEFRGGLDDEDPEEASEWDDVPDAETVSRTPDGHSHSTVYVEEIYHSEHGLKAVLDGPAPWETSDDETPMNEVLKSLPWGDVHYDFESDEEVWTVDANELVGVASEFAFHGYSVSDEADRNE